MFKKKSFDLINEEDTKKPKDAKRFGSLQLLVVPSLVCFALILILVNVDFNGIADMNKDRTENPIENMESTGLLQLYSGDVNTESTNFLAPRTGICTTVKNDACKLTCTVMSSDRKALNQKLETKYKICNGPLDVRMQASLFNDNTFNKADLNGNFRLANLTFYGCIINNIADGAFDKSSLNNLENLQMLGVKLERISEKTFAGLKKLKYFEMTNQPLSKKLTANAMLKPMAATLKEFLFTHDSAIEEKFDPGKWLNGAHFIKLTYVDLKNNFFPNTLNRASFDALKSVEYLSLHNCYIDAVREDTFDPILGTLRYLILSQNSLRHLSPPIVVNMAFSEVELTLTNNLWDCGCPNYKFIKALQNDKIKLSEVPLCSTPIEWENHDMKSVKMCCTENEDECKKEKTKTVTTERTITTTELEAISDNNKKSDYSTSTKSYDVSYQEIELICKRFPAEKETITIFIKDQLVYFKIATINNTGVEISFKAITTDSTLWYFNNHTNNNEKHQTLQATVIILTDLLANETYAFCLVPLNESLMSPFNCRSHYMGQLIRKQVIEAWLTSEDFAIFITLTTFAVIVCLLIGLVAGYLILRWRPTLLKTKRLVKLSPESKQEFLKRLTTDEVYEAFRNYAPVFQLSLNDYVKYYSSLDLPSKIELLSSTENIPPKQRAPAMPPMCQQLRTISTQSTILADDNVSLKTIPEDFNEHEYQSLEEYYNFYGDIIRSQNI